MSLAGYNVRKAAQVAAFFALKEGGQINVLKLTKLIYLADRESLNQYDCPILYDKFVSMTHGPVNSKTYDYINGCEEDAAWDDFIAGRAGHFVGVTNKALTIDDLDELSAAELEILEGLWSKFGKMDRYELRNYTHKYCPEWENPHDSSTPISYERVLKFLNKDGATLAQAIEEDRQLYNI